jgi:hypothetical protein
MLLLTEPTLFYWNLLNDFTSDLKQAYTGGITTWAQKVHKVNVEKNACLAKPPKSLTTSSLNQSTNKALSQLTRVTTAASTATPPPVTPTHSTFGDDFAEVAEPGCFPDEDNHPERMAAFALVGMRKPSGLRNAVAPVEYFTSFILQSIFFKRIL